ncbi:response regulator transcription factor [Bradyrhizobium sp. BR 1432]|uniref:response regulator transcription factor n=1 Tax=Bradyrhizobium sp. BR 1432 TaxID=3447966 RepID=UPI003EE5D716
MNISLSAREKECLNWAAQGKSSSEIADIVSISVHTVNFHLKNSMKKLGVNSRTTACLHAVRLGLIVAPAAVHDMQ